MRAVPRILIALAAAVALAGRPATAAALPSDERHRPKVGSLAEPALEIGVREAQPPAAPKADPVGDGIALGAAVGAVVGWLIDATRQDTSRRVAIDGFAVPKRAAVRVQVRW